MWLSLKVGCQNIISIRVRWWMNGMNLFSWFIVVTFNVLSYFEHSMSYRQSYKFQKKKKWKKKFFLSFYSKNYYDSAGTLNKCGRRKSNKVESNLNAIKKKCFGSAFTVFIQNNICYWFLMSNASKKYISVVQFMSMNWIWHELWTTIKKRINNSSTIFNEFPSSKLKPL